MHHRHRVHPSVVLLYVDEILVLAEPEACVRDGLHLNVHRHTRGKLAVAHRHLNERRAIVNTRLAFWSESRSLAEMTRGRLSSINTTELIAAASEMWPL
ncbi:hypothetical protein E2C01_034466 [Portunus trituberculatus]|uniref:Reverse transcriptase domain-containing protein n=1 Tax=Portunus trituberculatus TaxID=210409 RepID=A0A5B7F2X1_PORTR|nr:hypothetical protein [Portunus trituberculatus]